MTHPFIRQKLLKIIWLLNYHSIGADCKKIIGWLDWLGVGFLKELNMKAFRNVGGTVIEIDVDVDPNGQPILPPDTTTDARPEPQAGHYVTVVDNAWVQIPVPQAFTTFEYSKQQALEALSKYKEWYLEQTVELNGVTFDADDTARTRLTQALVVHSVSGVLPPAWIATDNSIHPLPNIEVLLDIVNAVQTAFVTRFFEMNTIRQQILAANDEATLNTIAIPSIPTNLF